MRPRATQAKAKRQEGPAMMLAQYGQNSGQNHDPRAFVLVIETRQTITQAANGWQVSVQQLRWLVPVSQTQKSAPNKT